MKWRSDLHWTNVRPVADELQDKALRTFNAIDACFSNAAPAWAGFTSEETRMRSVTIKCGRCGSPYTYVVQSSWGATRKYCNSCVRTNTKRRVP